MALLPIFMYIGKWREKASHVSFLKYQSSTISIILQVQRMSLDKNEKS